MGEEDIQIVMLCTYIVEAILQIIMLLRFKKHYFMKDWRTFAETNIVSSICIGIALVNTIYCSMGLNSALRGLMMHGSCLTVNIVLLAVGLLMRNKNREKITYNNKNIRSIIVLLCNLFILIVIPIILHQASEINASNFVIKYLEKKYGNGNYKIVKVREQYSYVGIIDKYLSGYSYEVKCDYMEGTFAVETDEKSTYVTLDYFLPIYYSEKYNLYYERHNWGLNNSLSIECKEFKQFIINKIETKYSIKADRLDVSKIYSGYVHSWNSINGVKYNPGYYVIPDNYGRIPTIEELTYSIVKNYNNLLY